MWAQIMKKGRRSDELPVIAADCDHESPLLSSSWQQSSGVQATVPSQPRRGGGMPFRHLETWLETGRQSPCLGVLPADCTAGTCLGPNLQHLPAVRVSSAVCSQAREIIFVF